MNTLQNIYGEFAPRKGISERYSLESIAKRHGLTVEEYKSEIDAQIKVRHDMVELEMKNGLTYEQAYAHVLRCLYINGFSGPTFKD
jgi:hypothetical protein